MPPEVQRLYAAAGAEIERAADRCARGDAGEGQGRATDPEHVVDGDLADVAARGVGSVVADDVPVGVALAVRPDVDQRPQRRAAPDQAEGEQVVQREVPGDVGPLHLLAEDEQPHELRVRTMPVLQGAAGGHALVATQRGVRGRAQHGEEAVGGEARVEERLAQPEGRRTVRAGEVDHAPIMAHPGRRRGPGGVLRARVDCVRWCQEPCGAWSPSPSPAWCSA